MYFSICMALKIQKIFVCAWVYLIGFVHVLQERAALVAPWIMGCVAFLALEAVAMVYSNVLRDHVNRVSLFYLRVCFLCLTRRSAAELFTSGAFALEIAHAKPAEAFVFVAEATLADDVLRGCIQRKRIRLFSHLMSQ